MNAKMLGPRRSPSATLVLLLGLPAVLVTGCFNPPVSDELEGEAYEQGDEAADDEDEDEDEGDDDADSGKPDEPSSQNEPESEPALRTLAVGAWGGIETLTLDGTAYEVEQGWMLCPSGKMVGYTLIDEYEAVGTGEYSVDEDAETIGVGVTMFDTTTGDALDPWSNELGYDRGSDTFTFLDGWGGMTMVRLDLEVTDADCE